jgi:hypothetical protein
MQLKDVIFGEAAINYEEGKWEYVHDQGLLFRPDYNRVSASVGDMQAFAESRNRPKYHYGEYISGSAVRADAGVVFEKIRSGVSFILFEIYEYTYLLLIGTTQCNCIRYGSECFYPVM